MADIITEGKMYHHDSETTAILLICEIGWTRDKRGEKTNEN